MLLKAFRRIRERDPAARMILVPRHGERREEIRALLEREAVGLRWHFKSKGLPESEIDVLVGDTHGELRGFTQVSDLAFVGKSLPPHTEGQTPIECGLLGVPMVFGNGMSNFKSIQARLVECGAARRVGSAEEAVEVLRELSFDGESRGRMSRGGLEWAAASRGALRRTLDRIEAFLSEVG